FFRLSLLIPIIELFWSVATMVSVPFGLHSRCKPRSLPGVRFSPNKRVADTWADEVDMRSASGQNVRRRAEWGRFKSGARFDKFGKVSPHAGRADHRVGAAFSLNFRRPPRRWLLVSLASF